MYAGGECACASHLTLQGPPWLRVNGCPRAASSLVYTCISPHTVCEQSLLAPSAAVAAASSSPPPVSRLHPSPPVRPHTSVCEQPLPAPSAAVAAALSSPPPVVLIGLCAVDVASGHVLVGQFPDDEVRVACLRVRQFPDDKMRVVCGRGPRLSSRPTCLTPSYLHHTRLLPTQNSHSVCRSAQRCEHSLPHCSLSSSYCPRR